MCTAVVALHQAPCLLGPGKESRVSPALGPHGGPLIEQQVPRCEGDRLTAFLGGCRPSPALRTLGQSPQACLEEERGIF